MAEIKLHGAWPSRFVFRVECALKIKGIPYEYIEENLTNKSPLLLQYNPIHKKVPVLVHGGKPICESMVIIEYLNEAWPENPLLPTDPYERAQARFWIKFGEEKGSAIAKLMSASGEELEKAGKEILEMLETIESQALGDKKFFGGEKIGMLDIAYSEIAHWLGVLEEAAEVKIFEANKFPRLYSWSKNFREDHIVKETLPDREKMLGFFKKHREMALASA